MSIKNSPVKNIVYLLILSLVLVFSLYNLFSEDARSWFVVNKRVSVNPVYGRVLTTGAGRNLAAFKNDNNSFGDGQISEEGDGETAALIMLPGDIIHFVFMIAVDDPSVIDSSTLILQGLAGDVSLRQACRVLEGKIAIAPVKFEASEDENGNLVYNYTITDLMPQPWQLLSNEAISSFDTGSSSDLSIQIGVSNIITPENPADGGAYTGKYIFLLDIPIFYVDTGEDQNTHKYDGGTITDPEQLPLSGWMLIERCVFIYTAD